MSQTGEIHKELNIKYNIPTTFLQIIQIQKSIPRTRTQVKIKCTTTSNININEDNIPINIENKHTTIDKVKCREYFWQLIKYKHYTPKTIKKWSNTYPDFDNAEQKIWPRTFELPFKCCREAKIQSFQYRIILRIIPYNSWLKNITIKNNKCSYFCNEIDDIPTFYYSVLMSKDFRNHALNGVLISQKLILDM